METFSKRQLLVSLHLKKITNKQKDFFWETLLSSVGFSESLNLSNNNSNNIRKQIKGLYTLAHTQSDKGKEAIFLHLPMVNFY